MSHIHARVAVKKYNEVGVQSGVGHANPHQLVQMLINGTLDRIATAKGHMNRSETSGKCENIGKAIGILDGLRNGLDMDTGGKIAQNLDDLYDYMERRLVEANASNQSALLDEVSQLLGEIKTAWDAIPHDVIQQHAARNHQAPVVG